MGDVGKVCYIRGVFNERRGMFSRIAYGLVWALSFLPLGVLYVLADVLYVVMYRVARYRLGVVRENLRRVFPGMGERERRGVERRFYRHLADVTVELARMWHMGEREMRRRCVFRNAGLVEGYLREGRSVVAALGHYGNWEWMASFALWMEGGDFLVLYKRLRDGVVDGMMRRVRGRFGAVPVERREALRVMARRLGEGRPFLAGFIADQSPNGHNLGFWMDFLGQDTAVLTGAERIARRYGLPVVSVRTRRTRRGYYEVEFVEVCRNPRELEEGEVTRRYTRMLEEEVRREPALWLWSHRRWKHAREEATRG